MTSAIMMSWRNYQPYGDEFYRPLWYGFLNNLKLWAHEFDKLYILDSQWNFTQEDIRQLSLVKDNFEIIVTDPSLRYYDAYKKYLPQVKEDLVMYLDNDMVIYKSEVVEKVFAILETDQRQNIDGVVTIYDTIGEYKTEKMRGKNKFCPYLFATRTELLKRYLDVDWGPDMPYCETLGHLTEKMLEDGIRPFELEEDKSNILFDGTKDGEKSKDLGYYHIRAGSTPAYLLAEKKYGNPETYWKYLKEQPKSEYLRQVCWYNYMGGDAGEITYDLGLSYQEFWVEYFYKFREYHGLMKI